ncbi:hypothetical protein ASZ90_020171 [hydrocarbon metagenome]|uniref:Uncharacterized protein n=1 Tax=hydrocarbon metagenome TaxID=938273 RepID=A0A0W8E1R0_9ZZZZ
MIKSRSIIWIMKKGMFHIHKYYANEAGNICKGLRLIAGGL